MGTQNSVGKTRQWIRRIAVFLVMCAIWAFLITMVNGGISQKYYSIGSGLATVFTALGLGIIQGIFSTISLVVFYRLSHKSWLFMIAFSIAFFAVASSLAFLLWYLIVLALKLSAEISKLFPPAAICIVTFEALSIAAGVVVGRFRKRRRKKERQTHDV